MGSCQAAVTVFLLKARRSLIETVNLSLCTRHKRTWEGGGMITGTAPVILNHLLPRSSQIPPPLSESH